MAEWKCTTCGWIYDPEQGDPERKIGPGIAFEDLPDSWICPICTSGKEFFELEVGASKWTFDHEKLSMDYQEQQLTPVGINVYKDRFENVFRVAQKLTSSLNIGEVLELIRDEARLTLLNCRRFASSW